MTTKTNTPHLTENEIKALLSMYDSAMDMGGDFGMDDEVAWDGDRKVLGALMASLSKKGLVYIAEPERINGVGPAVRQFEFSEAGWEVINKLNEKGEESVDEPATEVEVEPVVVELGFHGTRPCTVVGAKQNGDDIFASVNAAGRVYLLERKARKETAKGYTQAKMIDEADLLDGKVYDAKIGHEALRQVEVHLNNIRSLLEGGRRTTDEERGAGRSHWYWASSKAEKQERLDKLTEARDAFIKRNGLEG